MALTAIPVSKLAKIAKEIKAGNKVLKGVDLTEKELKLLNDAGYFEEAVVKETTIVDEKANAVEYGEHIGKNGNKKILKPNVEYVDGNGYKYTTDDLGRINNTSGELNLGQGTRNSYAQRTVGGADRLPTDDGGHLIASQFNGSGQIDNLIPQNSGINRAGGEWYNMEKSWSDALKSGSKVEVNIKPNYNLNSVRPDSFNVEYWIDGEKFIKFIRNP